MPANPRPSHIPIGICTEMADDLTIIVTQECA